MNGLVWKDATLLRNGLIYVAVFGVVFSMLFSESNVMGIVCPMLFSSLVASSFAWDDQCKWDMYAVSAGIPRNRIVMSKYMSSVVFITIGFAIGLAVSLVMPSLTGAGTDLESAAVVSVTGWVLSAMVLSAIVVSISILVNYWTGSSVKAQYVSIVVLMASIAFLVSATIIASDLLGGNMLMVTGVLLVIAVLMFAGTYKASCARFEKRDL